MNRLTLLVLLAAMVLVPGCEPKVTSPFTGKDATASEILSQRDRAEREARETAAAEAKAAQDEIRQTQAQALRAAATLRATAEKSAIQARTDLTILQADTNVRLASADARLEAASADLERTLAAINQQTDTAIEAAQAKANAITGAAKFVLDNPVVKSAAATVGVDTGGVSSLLTLAFGAGVVGWMNKRAKQREDAAYDEAAAREKARAAEEKAIRDRARDQAKIEQLALLTDPAALRAVLGSSATNPAEVSK